MQSSPINIFNEQSILDAAPRFEEDRVFYQSSGYNCFSYAIGYRGSIFPKGIELDIEGLSTLISLSGILPITNNNLINTPEGHYPIAGFVSLEERVLSRQEQSKRFRGDRTIPCFPFDGVFSDYHWYRINQGLTLSHKPGKTAAPREIISYDKGIKDPRDIIKGPIMTRTYRDDRYGHYYDHFIGFYAVPKGGIVSLEINQSIDKNNITDHIKESLKHRRQAPQYKRKERKSDQGYSLSLKKLNF